MLTKRQTLLAIPILLASLVTTWFLGYALQEWFSVKIGIIVLIGCLLVVNAIALIAMCFAALLSFGTAMFFNAASPEWWEKTGNPFYYFLWKELQEATTRQAGERDS